MRVTWAQIEPGLPPADRCGSIQALDLCEPTVQSFLREPLKALVDLESVDPAPKPGMMMGSRKENIKIARGLLQRRLVRILERDELLWVGKEDQRRPLLNGWFGVSKGTKLESDPSKDVLRLIMNLTASNSVQKAWPGDIGAL
eukprot:8033724-Karenia_brevis.AAC.1